MFFMGVYFATVYILSLKLIHNQFLKKMETFSDLQSYDAQSTIQRVNF